MESKIPAQRVSKALTRGRQFPVPVVAEPKHLELPPEGVDVGVRRHLF